MKLTCLVMPLFTLCIGCSGVANNYMAVHKAGLQSIAYANEMERVLAKIPIISFPRPMAVVLFGVPRHTSMTSVF